MYCIIVTTKLKPGTREKFLAAMRPNAAAALRDEPGCRGFDLLADRERPDTILQYELYDSPAAQEAHRRTGHDEACRAAIADLVESRSVTRLDVEALNPKR